ncbi:hypothetical protein JNW91_00605 [Micromonospora sp. STR1_7]|uniref:Uncharacterized protein n=1 Tax=Micromonospora parastrephiae TaxID=2806101 RepID=A0ABS1XMM0_9ACTN|nr:hypothetical protein [Micromonospora parastrephiae]MBM0230502.1 hypothetical protein [Micromonospora parastrephiae]
MEIRTVNGHRATDRAGAAEVLGLSTQTIGLYASPKQRPTTGFPAPIETEDRRDWYTLDDLDAYAETQHQRATSPRRAPAWLRDGHPDELLAATTFRAAAKVSQGTWKRYVQLSRPDWDAGTDGYLPKPDDEEDYRGTGKLYSWTRHRMIHWLDNRTGERHGAGRKPGPTPTVDDAIAAIHAADTKMTGATLAQALGVNLRSAQRLLRLARERLAATQR